MHTLKFTGTATREEFDAAVKEQEFWYHAYYFDNGYSVHGDWNIGLNIHEYGFPTDMTGMKVLDIGGGAGWFSFYFEQLGADVTIVDARGYCDFDVYGQPEYLPVKSEKATPDRVGEHGEAIYYGPPSGALWKIKDLLGSKVRFVNGRVYEVCPELFGGQKFDLVFMGAILPHLRDPIGALRAARTVCKDRLIASCHSWDEQNGNPHPVMFMPFVGQDKITWWMPNEACYKQWFLAAGFSSVDISRSTFKTPDIETTHEVLGTVRNATHRVVVGDARI